MAPRQAGWSVGGGAVGRNGSDVEAGPPAQWEVREDEARCPDGEGYGGGGGGGGRSSIPGIAIIYCPEE